MSFQSYHLADAEEDPIAKAIAGIKYLRLAVLEQKEYKTVGGEVLLGDFSDNFIDFRIIIRKSEGLSLGTRLTSVDFQNKGDSLSATAPYRAFLLYLAGFIKFPTNRQNNFDLADYLDYPILIRFFSTALGIRDRPGLLTNHLMLEHSNRRVNADGKEEPTRDIDLRVLQLVNAVISLLVMDVKNILPNDSVKTVRQFACDFCLCLPPEQVQFEEALKLQLLLVTSSPQAKLEAAHLDAKSEHISIPFNQPKLSPTDPHRQITIGEINTTLKQLALAMKSLYSRYIDINKRSQRINVRLGVPDGVAFARWARAFLRSHDIEFDNVIEFLSVAADPQYQPKLKELVYRCVGDKLFEESNLKADSTKYIMTYGNIVFQVGEPEPNKQQIERLREELSPIMSCPNKGRLLSPYNCIFRDIAESHAQGYNTVSLAVEDAQARGDTPLTLMPIAFEQFHSTINSLAMQPSLLGSIGATIVGLFITIPTSNYHVVWQSIRQAITQEKLFFRINYTALSTALEELAGRPSLTTFERRFLGRLIAFNNNLVVGSEQAQQKTPSSHAAITNATTAIMLALREDDAFDDYKDEKEQGHLRDDAEADDIDFAPSIEHDDEPHAKAHHSTTLEKAFAP